MIPTAIVGLGTDRPNSARRSESVGSSRSAEPRWTETCSFHEQEKEGDSGLFEGL